MNKKTTITKSQLREMVREELNSKKRLNESGIYRDIHFGDNGSMFNGGFSEIYINFSNNIDKPFAKIQMYSGNSVPYELKNVENIKDYYLQAVMGKQDKRLLDKDFDNLKSKIQSKLLSETKKIRKDIEKLIDSELRNIDSKVGKLLK